MSSNNQIIILKENGKFQVHENHCVDNEFKPSKDTLLKELKTLEWAVKFAQEYQKENLVEYGIYISPTCWGKSRTKKGCKR